MSPTGCPTPALVTRAVRELVGFSTVVADAGLAEPTAAPTVDLGATPGGDVREPEPVPDAASIGEAAREVGASLPAEDLVVAESVPGGTTTALGVLRALGEPYGVSSSLPENPIEQKRTVVEAGLAASDLNRGALQGRPVEAIRLMGDPALAAAVGLVEGATEAGVPVTLAGGTQMVAAAAVLRHAGLEASLSLATTRFVADDPGTDLQAAARGLDLDLVVSDPGFDGVDHPATDAFVRGEAKEGVGMGGALALAEGGGVPTSDVRDRLVALYAALVGEPADVEEPEVPDGGS